MPEGPEVTVLAEQLHSLLQKKYLRSIKIVSGPYKTDEKPIFKNTRTRIESLNRILTRKTTAVRIVSVHKKGKFIYFNLVRLDKQGQDMKETPFCIGSSLGLTGHYLFSSDSVAPSWVRLEFEFADHPKVGPFYSLYYTDKLSMGKLSLLEPSVLANKLNSIGIDALSPEFTFDAFKEIFERSQTPVYMALVDPKRISGIGNIYRSEIIFKAREQNNFDPFDSIGSLAPDAFKALYESIIEVLNLAVNKRGTSESNEASYRDLYGVAGSYEPTIYGKKITSDNREVLQFVDSSNRKFYYTA